MSVDKVRAKFFVKSIQHFHNSDPKAVCAEVKLAPCYGSYPGGDSEENKSFAKYTPQGEMAMTITNPAAIEFFEIGKPYYVDFTPAQ